MPAATTEQRALELVKLLRQAGENVSRVVVEGRKIEIEFSNGEPLQRIDGVKW